jgi:hypothetical protein
VSLAVARWAAWAPGLEDAPAWEQWSRAPAPLSGHGTPDVRFLPPLVRRRCSDVAKLMLHVAHAVDAPAVPTVFASRHGDCAGALDLMTDLASGTPLTAGAFSHSVHNTAAGLYSIVTGNDQPSTSTAGGSESFGAGVLEALGLLRRCAGGAVLLVMADAPVPALFAGFTSEPAVPYAVALLLAREGERTRVTVEAGGGPAARPPWPDAVELVRWLVCREPDTVIGDGRNALRWTLSRR